MFFLKEPLQKDVIGRQIPVCRGYSPLSCFIVPDNDFPIENDPRDPETDSQNLPSILQILSLSGAIALGMSIEVRVRASWLQNCECE
ncbi:hypothetical protein KUCAC02_008559, partial [Chaenocephalus aceratus]